MKRNLYLYLFIGAIAATVAIWFIVYREKEPVQKFKFCTEKYSAKTEKLMKGGRSTWPSLHELKAAMRWESAAAAKFIWANTEGLPLRLKVKFMNGTNFQRSKVQLYAREWETNSEHLRNGLAKIQFQFYQPNSPVIGDIRVWFEPGGSESAIGSDAKNYNDDEPTMKLGWVDPREDEESIRQVILHEFGHALGLIHEHQHPDAAIPWDTAMVYKYYKKTQNPPWDTAKTNFNIFRRYDRTTLNSLSYDSKSIMHYAIPDSLTKNKCCPVSWNSRLSNEDILIIRKLYRLTSCGLPETCCYDRNGVRIQCTNP